MKQTLAATAVGVSVAVGLTGVFLHDCRAEVRYNGGFVITSPAPSPAGGGSHRYEPHPPMQIGHPRRAPLVPIPLRTAGGATGSPQSVETLYGVAIDDLPWKQADFEGYDEPAARPAHDLPPGQAVKYSLESAPLARRDTAANGNTAVLVVHLPEDAVLWVEGKLTAAKGRTRHFESPPLEPGVKYSYRVRVAWVERGRLVSQVREVPVQAGKVRGLYLTLSPAEVVKKKRRATVEANLARLDPEDQEVARLQKICVVRPDTRLGETGVPVKVIVKKHRVFVCDKECVQKVLDEPDQTWARARELRARHAPKPPGK